MVKDPAKNRLAIFVILVICLAAIYSSIVYYVMSPGPTQSFMGLGVFSHDGLSGYTPASNSTVHPGQTVNWTLSVTNRMGSAQFIMIIVRLENASMTAPTSTTPSIGLPEIATPHKFIGDGETANVTFNWTINSASQSGKLVYLNLTVNGRQSQTSSSVGAVAGLDFRWVFELWTYDLSFPCGDPLAPGCFHYGYGPQTSPTGCWLQVWFNVS